MKSIKYIGIIAVTLVTFLVSSCSDKFLEEKSDLAGFNDEVFQDSLLAKAYVDYVYGLFLPKDNAQSMIWDLPVNGDDFTQTTEELAGETNWNKQWSMISSNQNHCLAYFGQRISTSVSNNTWTRMKQINIFLNSVDQYGLPESTRNRLKGQLYFWRAYQYFDLLRLYGGVPIVLEAENPILGDSDGTATPRSSSEETLQQIVSDLDMAIEMLPGRWGSDNWGRITSGGAAAFKGRVLLTWASPLFNRSDESSRWQDAYQANLEARDLLEANGFGLYTSGGTADATAWENMWFEEVNNPEAVIVYGFNNVTSNQVQRNNGWEKACRSQDINGSGSISPTKQMVDAFPMKDGKMPGESSYTYSDQKFYKNRDPRFYKTFAYNGGLWPFGGNSDYRQWTYKWYANDTQEIPGVSTESTPNSSGIYCRKATDPSASNSNNFDYSGTDYMELRFAEVVLNLAESAIGANQLSEGLNGIIEIRERAGVENLNGYYGLDAGMTRDQLFAAVLRERQVEFAYEGKRFWDLRRWMLFDDNYGTVSRLGTEPINGTRRTGYFIVVKDAGENYVGSEDPMLAGADGTAPVIDRDPDSYPEGVTTYDEYVDYLYDNYFEVIEKDDLDVTSTDWYFTWYDEYYFFGIHQNILDASPYLEQTVGWGGTFDPLD